MTKYPKEKLNQCVEILGEFRNFALALKRIAFEVDPALADSSTLAKAFRRNGLRPPSHYLGTPQQVSVIRPPPQPEAGDFDVAVEWEDDGEETSQFESAPPPAAPLLRVLIIPDVHVPYHDDLAWRTALAVARGWRPDVGVILGDFADFYQVSQYPKDPRRKLGFGEEIRAVTAELTRFAALRIPRVICCEGNHETRYQRLIASEAPRLSGVPGVASDAQQLLSVQQRYGWEWVPYGHHASVGKLHFMHDAGHAGVYAARQSVASFGGNIVFGHTHRAGCHYESTVGGDRHVGWTMGWLGDPEAIDYKHRARVLRENQHGVGFAYVEQSTGLAWVNFAPIMGGRCVIDGNVYDGRSYREAA